MSTGYGKSIDQGTNVSFLKKVHGDLGISKSILSIKAKVALEMLPIKAFAQGRI